MSCWKDIVTVVGTVLVAAGVLIGGVHWAVTGAVEPLRNEVRDLRSDVHGIDVRLVRVEERLDRVESGQAAIGERLDRIEALKVAQR